MKTLLFLALCISASAAPLPPFPTGTIKRPAPLLSPKAASVPKSTPMFVPASVNPPVPMMVEWVPASDGQITLIVDALKPANKTMRFDYAPTASGPWSYLMGWGAYPESEWRGVAWTVSQPVFVKASHGAPIIATLRAVSLVSPPGVVSLPATKTKPRSLK